MHVTRYYHCNMGHTRDNTAALSLLLYWIALQNAFHTINDAFFYQHYIFKLFVSLRVCTNFKRTHSIL